MASPGHEQHTNGFGVHRAAQPLNLAHHQTGERFSNSQRGQRSETFQWLHQTCTNHSGDRVLTEHYGCLPLAQQGMQPAGESPARHVLTSPGDEAAPAPLLITQLHLKNKKATATLKQQWYMLGKCFTGAVKLPWREPRLNAENNRAEDFQSILLFGKAALKMASCGGFLFITSTTPT